AKGDKGDPGTPGAQGATGPSVASTAIVVTSSTTNDDARITASCASGYVAVGGGGSLPTGQALDSSYPSNSTGTGTARGQQPTAWTISWSTQQDQTGTVYAICVR